MNLILSFVRPGRPAKTLGPFQSVRIERDTLRERHAGAAIAVHRKHQWEVAGEKYFRLDCTTRVTVHFETPQKESRRFGPYDRLSAVDGVAYADDRVFAFVDGNAGDWFCYDDGRHWNVMVLTDAAAAGGRKLLAFVAALAPLLPGVYQLWHASQLVYIGRADGNETLRSRLLAHAAHRGALDSGAITACRWEVHSRPALREAEVLAEESVLAFAPPVAA